MSVLLTDGLRLVADPGALDPAVAAGAAAPLLDAVPGLLGGAAPHLLVAGVARVVTCNVDCLESMLTKLPVPYDLCISVPISCLLIPGLTPV